MTQPGYCRAFRKSFFPLSVKKIIMQHVTANESHTNDFTMGSAGPNIPRPTSANIPNAPTPPPPNPRCYPPVTICALRAHVMPGGTAPDPAAGSSGQATPHSDHPSEDTSEPSRAHQSPCRGAPTSREVVGCEPGLLALSSTLQAARRQTCQHRRLGNSWASDAHHYDGCFHSPPRPKERVTCLWHRIFACGAMWCTCSHGREGALVHVRV